MPLRPLEGRCLHTVLAALRFYQSRFIDFSGKWPDGDEFIEISSDGGTVEPLTEEEIDALAEVLNSEDESERFANLDGNAVEMTRSSDGTLVVQIDTENTVDDDDGDGKPRVRVYLNSECLLDHIGRSPK